MSSLLDDPFTLATTADVPPNADNVRAEPAEGELWCETGAHYFAHSGRGRKPKNCVDHRVSKDSTPRTPRASNLKAPLQNMYASVGMMLYPFDPTCASAVIQSAEQCAEALDQLAKTNPNVRRVLESLTKTSAWGTVIAAHLPVLMVIAQHHVPNIRDAFMPSVVVNDATDSG